MTFKNVLDAVAYIHSKNYVHLDLGWRQVGIYIKPNGETEIKLGDLGEAMLSRSKRICDLRKLQSMIWIIGAYIREPELQPVKDLIIEMQNFDKLSSLQEATKMAINLLSVGEKK